MKESKTANRSAVAPETPTVATAEILSDFNQRFEILAEELNTVKDLLLKLQSYTMDVNKALYEERIHVFSGMGTMSNTPEEQTVANPGDAYLSQSAINENIIAALSELDVGGVTSD
jgi:hypothetical protein